MQAIKKVSQGLTIWLSLFLFTPQAMADTYGYWLLATNVVGTTTMTDGAVTLNVKVTSAASRTLTAMGLDRDRIDSALRVSFSDTSNEEDVRALLAALDEGLSVLSRR